MTKGDQRPEMRQFLAMTLEGCRGSLKPVGLWKLTIQGGTSSVALLVLFPS